MIVDTSAVVAILRGETDADALTAALFGAGGAMSVANQVELGLVSNRYAPLRQADIDLLLDRLHITIVPVSVEHGRLALEAHRRFGRGSGSPARLDHGDCFAYALAVQTGEPLLFKGGDFSHTDVTPAL